jgi:hypothetical protein
VSGELAQNGKNSIYMKRRMISKKISHCPGEEWDRTSPEYESRPTCSLHSWKVYRTNPNSLNEPKTNSALITTWNAGRNAVFMLKECRLPIVVMKYATETRRD